VANMRGCRPITSAVRRLRTPRVWPNALGARERMSGGAGMGRSVLASGGRPDEGRFRSRWRGSMLAWSLNTKALNSAAADHGPSWLWGTGGWGQSRRIEEGPHAKVGQSRAKNTRLSSPDGRFQSSRHRPSSNCVRRGLTEFPATQFGQFGAAAGQVRSPACRRARLA